MSGGVRSTLAAGRAPICWQRNLARKAARLENLRRMCAWVRPLAATRPALRDKPLFGHCLAQLTEQAARPPDAKSETPRPRPRPFSHDDSGDRDRNVVRADGRPGAPTNGSAGRPPELLAEKRTPRRAPLPPDLNRRAAPALLERLSGSSDKPSAISHQPSAINKAPRPKPGVSSGAPRAPVSIRHWQQGLVGQRAVAMTSREGDRVSVRHWQQTLVGRLKRVLRRDGDDGVESLADVWTTRLTGQTAPGDWLVRLARMPVADGGASERTLQPQSTPQQSPGTRSADRTVSDVARVGHGQATPTTAVERDATHGLTAGGETVQTPLLAAGGAGDTEGRLRPSARIAPPAVAPVLPELLPGVVGEPVPAVAAAIVRHGARRESAASEDDLGVLASRIKRILDEEARRHGIDV